MINSCFPVWSYDCISFPDELDRMPKELVLSHNNITTLENAVFAPLLDQMLAAYGDSAYILLDREYLHFIKQRVILPKEYQYIYNIRYSGHPSDKCLANLIPSTGNELGCDCDMAWIVEHPGRNLFQQATCADGRLLSNLNLADFAHC